MFYKFFLMIENLSLNEYQMLAQLIISFLLGSIIGYERELKYKPAGLRTHILVCLASTLFTILSINAFPGADKSRVASAILMGIGFIGAGTVIQIKDKIVGLTTAASLWITAAIGMAVGAGLYFLAATTTMLVFFVLRFVKILEYRMRKSLS